MTNPDIVINTLLENGLRQRNLNNVLASNCVVDWFGRTYNGQRKVIQFYENSITKLEHSFESALPTEAFEDRPNHLKTREQPPENLINTIVGEECDTTKWFDCVANTPSHLKEGQRTPDQKQSPPPCPQAPYRNAFARSLSDDETDSSTNEDDSNESGIHPFDSSMEFDKEKTPKIKRLRRERKRDLGKTSLQETPESTFSELHYLSAAGNVTLKRPGSEEQTRECKILLSYRISKEDPSVIQIALIIYKSNSERFKTRRNLVSEFGGQSLETSTPKLLLFDSQLSSRSQTSVKNQPKTEEDVVKTEPAKSNHRPLKRPISKCSLRF